MVDRNNNLPILLTGDFNSQPTEEPYQVMINGTDIQLIDARPATDLTGTSCGFEVGPENATRLIIYFLLHTGRARTIK